GRLDRVRETRLESGPPEGLHAFRGRRRGPRPGAPVREGARPGDVLRADRGRPRRARSVRGGPSDRGLQAAGRRVRGGRAGAVPGDPRALSGVAVFPGRRRRGGEPEGLPAPGGARAGEPLRRPQTPPPPPRPPPPPPSTPPPH